MISDETNPKEFKNFKGAGHYSHIKGWAIDADSENDPTYPIKKRGDWEQEGDSWERPQQQPVDIEVLQSIERPNITRVFGTSVPPKGLSGTIRRMAFKKSESSYGHWLPLVLADRIGVYEGLMEDFKRGYFPNIFAERGWQAEWKYNRKNFLINTAFVALIATAAVAVLVTSKKQRNSDY